MNACIVKATAKEDYILFLQLDNGNELKLDMKQLLQYPVFTKLEDKVLWNNIEADKNFLIWRGENVELKISIDTLLDYFA